MEGLFLFELFLIKKKFLQSHKKFWVRPLLKDTPIILYVFFDSLFAGKQMVFMIGRLIVRRVFRSRPTNIAQRRLHMLDVCKRNDAQGSCATDHHLLCTTIEKFSPNTGRRHRRRYAIFANEQVACSRLFLRTESINSTNGFSSGNTTNPSPGNPYLSHPGNRLNTFRKYQIKRNLYLNMSMKFFYVLHMCLCYMQ